MTKHQPDRKVGGVTNGERAEWAASAVRAYTKIKYQGPDELQSVVGDLLCDLCHLLSSCGYDLEQPESSFSRMAGIAWGNYEAETCGGEPHEGGPHEDYEPPFAQHPRREDLLFWDHENQNY